MATSNDELPVGKILGVFVLFFALCIGIDWFVHGNDFFLYKFFGPKFEQARRETYEQTKSYKQGSVQRLDSLCLQYSTADAEHKPMLGEVIRHEFAEWDLKDVPEHLRSCLQAARN